MESKIKVLVCGTVFGQVYIRGVLNNPYFELRGIYSRGSEQSQRVAGLYQTQLYTSMRDVTKKDFDLALVVVRSGIVGGTGHEIAQALLEKGIDVIQEQPVHMEEAINTFKVANKNHLFYKINTFYKYMPASIVFHQKLEEVAEKSQILSIDGSCSLPVLLPYLDQIGRIFGGLFSVKINRNRCYSVNGQSYINMEVKGVNVTFRIQHGEEGAYALNELNAITERGNLKLTEVNGQVIWIAKPYVAEEFLRSGKADSKKDKVATEILYDVSGRKYSELYEQIWPTAVKNMLDSERVRINQHQCNSAEFQYYMALCRLWKEISQLI